MNRKYSEPYEAYDRGVMSGEIPCKPIPQTERKKYALTMQMDVARIQEDYKAVVHLADILAEICHKQGLESDAYKLEHEAFLYIQKQVYKDAGISVNMFQNIPYAEKLKEAMTTEAELATKNKMIEYAVCYKKMTARICRAQGKERDAYILECAVYPMLKKAGEIKKNKELTDAEMESQCMQWIAEKYSIRLWDEE